MAKKRKLIPVSEEVINSLAPIAHRAGMTIPELVEMILLNASRVLRTRDDIALVMAENFLLADLTKLGYMPIPFNEFISVIETCSDESYKRLKEESSKLARLITTAIRARGINGSEALTILVKTLLPQLSIDVVETNNENHYKLVAFSTSLESDRARKLVEEVLRGILAGLGLSVNYLDSKPGILVIEARVPEKRRDEKDRG